jgi:hypothetical protein
MQASFSRRWKAPDLAAHAASKRRVLPLSSVRPERASFGPDLRSRISEILNVAGIYELCRNKEYGPKDMYDGIIIFFYVLALLYWVKRIHTCSIN